MKLLLSTTVKCKVHAIIRFLNAIGNTPIEIHHQLTEVYDESCMDIKSIRKWCWEFAFGRTEIHDEKQSGRPSTCKDTIAKVEESMCKDRLVSLDDLWGFSNHHLSDFDGQVAISESVRKMGPTNAHRRPQTATSGLCPWCYADEKDNFLDSIVTGNKTWAYHFTPEMDQQSRQWQHSSLPKL